ncbi:glycosyl hydrolase 2 galactose-binding domain-containing protein [Actinomadura verrucosospora]|uniref:Exo-beta-D-glucosaminidase n=1 Tax=Actinomadura verrucosospora TaxID=46165 RepID=A0A7D3VPT9_ACTVE|nr:sugar-binding domain-containing protein [Actinomadura verrucosospora]QKG19798.1 exo-beta-D-glucosaminidase [Actinomadura verrucosospora]
MPKPGRPQAALAACALLSVPPCAVSGAQARPEPAVLAPAGEDGASELVKGWRIQSSSVAGSDGARISRPGYRASGWLPIGRPETLMAGLLENGRYPHVFFSDRLRSVPAGQFAVNWWYRDEVTLHPRRDGRTFLIMDGVSGTADLWVNGTRIDVRSRLQGSYSRFEYDVTRYVHDGANAIALDVAPNKAKTYLTGSRLDWNPAAPDQGTGLDRPPKIVQDGPVSLRDTHVVQRNAPDFSRSDLTVKALLRNNTGTVRRAEFSGAVGRGTTRLPFRTTVTLPPNATRPVALRLRLRHPDVWWPYQLGGQPLYHLAAHVRADGRETGRYAEDFGIRTVTTSLTRVVPGRTHAPHGYRRFAVNGVPIVIRGGGWSPDMFLRSSARNVRDQLGYVKNLGLNALRLEGNFPPDDMFRQMDREGVLAMTGWQCCDRWEDPYAKWSRELQDSAAVQAAAVARRLRDHPSVFTFFQGSDAAPDAAKEAVYLSAFKAADWGMPQVASAEYKASPRLGPSGVKEGPYNYVPPVYWWSNGRETAGRDPSFTNAGSAWGFDTETSAGNTVPTQDSLDRFLTPQDQAAIWDPVTARGPRAGRDLFHVYPYNDYTRTARMGQYNTPLWHRYGPWSDMASYQRIAQMGGYEIARAQFEAYLGNSKDPADPSTGVIYWMMNKAWPSLQWNLYGQDFDQPGAYFGAKKAGEPVHVMYDYATHAVKVADLTGRRQTGLTARVRLIDLDGTVKRTSRVTVPPLVTQDVRTVATARAPQGISRTYFLELTLTRRGTAVSRNVYWLSTKPDAVDWANTLGKGSGAAFRPGGYADLTGLRALPRAAVRASATTRRDGADLVTRVTIKAAGTAPTVLTRADVRRGGPGGRPLPGDGQVLPIRWDDNDVTLWPGQSQTLTARYRASDLRGATPVVGLAGWNLPPRTVPAPARR